MTMAMPMRAIWCANHCNRKSQPRVPMLLGATKSLLALSVPAGVMADAKATVATAIAHRSRECKQVAGHKVSLIPPEFNRKARVHNRDRRNATWMLHGEFD